MANIMNYTRNQAQWDKIYSARRWWDFRCRKFRYGPSTGWERDLFIELARHVPEKGSVLSVGCGRALLDYWLAVLLGSDVHLLDLSKAVLEKVRRSFGPVSHTIHLHDALRLPFPDKSFDVVWNAGVWEHFPEEHIFRGIGEMARVCKGFVLVAVPNARCQPYVLSKAWLEEQNLWKFGLEKPKCSLKEYFQAADLEVIEERPIGSKQTCLNYLNMIPDETARKEITSHLKPEDYQVYPLILAIGKRKESLNLCQ